MLFLAKLVVVLLAFIIRLARLFPRLGKTERVEVVRGVSCTVQIFSNKKTIVSTVFEIPFKCRAIFKLTEEDKADRFFKWLGVADEVQTNDPEFDRKIYVASDDYHFKQEMKKDARARELILDLFRDGCKSITCDGAFLSVTIPGDRRYDQKMPSKCVEFYEQISEISQNAKKFFYDPFVYKVFAIEAAIWSFSTYSYLTYFEWNFLKEDIHLDHYSLFRLGLLMGCALTVALFFGIVFLLRGSSRGHRILVESFFVLLASLPVGGIALAADLNTQLDRSASTFVTGEITALYEKVHRQRRTTYKTYHLRWKIKGDPPEIEVPTEISISSSTYYALKQSPAVILEIGRGRLHRPWFRSIQPGTANW